MKLSIQGLLVSVLSYTSLLILVMSSLFFFANRLLVECIPTIEAAGQIKLNAASAHMWTDEIIAGDKSHNTDAVRQRLDMAEWYIGVMLTGGENDQGKYYALRDDDIYNEMFQLQLLFTDLRRNIEHQLDNPTHSFYGSSTDKYIDQQFAEFNSRISKVLSTIKTHYQQRVTSYQIVSGILIFVSILISIFIYRLLSKKAWEKERSIHSLTEENRHAEEKNRALHIQAHYDYLTGLPNRIHFIEALDSAITHAQQNGRFVAILFIDLDHFKAINDNYGHSMGDQLLKVVGNRILKAVRSYDTAARISGDEFIIILQDQPSLSECITSAKAVASSLITTLASPYLLNDLELKVTASIGIAIYPDDCANSDELISHADHAMYHAKSIGKNNFQFFNQDIDQKFTQQIMQEKQRKEAMH
ncbi:GGDEF domain-containing protein [Vibrio sp. 99-8-1]|uniref:GGDEF domain-containing protein n=1 Tax=Vibrio sp. 99-8-1 TaxID=2607602 RepID=UPI001493A296|nr:GGDEF domain-containing protein [Vibrio sp. 99-8-1]NOI66702.1 GGDEF domain-containing protein [Vibrio sp. 99-8-1]